MKNPLEKVVTAPNGTSFETVENESVKIIRPDQPECTIPLSDLSFFANLSNQSFSHVVSDV